MTIACSPSGVADANLQRTDFVAVHSCACKPWHKFAPRAGPSRMGVAAGAYVALGTEESTKGNHALMLHLPGICKS